MGAEKGCNVCGRSFGGLPYTCNECGNKHCSEHRLPEAHFCSKTMYVRDVSQQGGGWFKEEFALTNNEKSHESRRKTTHPADKKHDTIKCTECQEDVPSYRGTSCRCGDWFCSKHIKDHRDSCPKEQAFWSQSSSDKESCEKLDQSANNATKSASCHNCNKDVPNPKGGTCSKCQKQFCRTCLINHRSSCSGDNSDSSSDKPANEIFLNSSLIGKAFIYMLVAGGVLLMFLVSGGVI